MIPFFVLQQITNNNLRRSRRMVCRRAADPRPAPRGLDAMSEGAFAILAVVFVLVAATAVSYFIGKLLAFWLMGLV